MMARQGFCSCRKGYSTGRNNCRRADRFERLMHIDISFTIDVSYDKIALMSDPTMDRRRAMLRFLKFLTASPLLMADRKFGEASDPLLRPANVFDFAKLAESK